MRSSTPIPNPYKWVGLARTMVLQYRLLKVNYREMSILLKYNRDSSNNLVFVWPHLLFYKSLTYSPLSHFRGVKFHFWISLAIHFS